MYGNNTTAPVLSPRRQSNDTYKFSGTLLGLGSRENNKDKLEENRKQWVEDLKAQMERQRMVFGRFLYFLWCFGEKKLTNQARLIF